MDDHNLELENRMKNLVWTVSGDYDMKVTPDIDAYLKAKNTAVYDAVKQGALAKYLDRRALSQYLVRKLYYDAFEDQLLMVASLCIEEAVGERLENERRGIKTLRDEAYEEIRDREFTSLSGSTLGMLRMAYIRKKQEPTYQTTKKISAWLSTLYKAKNVESTMDLITIIDRLYNEVVEPDFEKNKATLKQILSVTVEELKENHWDDKGLSELYDEDVEVYIEHISESMSTLNIRDEAEAKPENTDDTSKKKVLVVDEAALSKMHHYVELNYGKSLLPKNAEESLNRRYCNGAHEGCSLHVTKGILESPVKVNYQYEYARKLRDKNRMEYYDNHRMVKQNIRVLTDLLRRSLLQRNEAEQIRSDHGNIDAASMWKINRSTDARVFIKEYKSDAMDFVVDVLLDASGSQRKRQGKVALQGFIISEALSNLDIPHRVTSFCSFWDYTILQRFRNYDDDRKENGHIFDYMTSANNRDGLAFRAVSDDLMKREESSKVLIVLSDGKPYDVMVQRENYKNAKPYKDTVAIYDSAAEVRRLRQKGVAVLGVFAGEDSEIAAEQKIFGRDFAYIRDIAGFSHVVGRYLARQIDAF